MKSSYLLTTALAAVMLGASCDSDNSLRPVVDATEGHSVTFTLKTPAGERVVYSRDGIHESDEYAINSLTLYEYEVGEDGSQVLTRIMKKDGNGANSLNMTENSSNSYTFSIIVPADNDGKNYTYRFVANDATANPALGSGYTVFAPTKAALVLDKDGYTADIFCVEGTGIAMSGVAKDTNGQEVITMAKNTKCEVQLTRIVSRIDIEYRTPNLKVKSVSLSGAPAEGTLFPAEELAVPTKSFSLGMNGGDALLPDDFLSELEDDTYSMKKAFYLYERANTADDCLTIHIEYYVAANGREDYEGAVDVPFRKTGENGEYEYIDAVRNHLYTIVLGNGDDPVSGKVSAAIKVNDWTAAYVDEPLTEDDPVKE